MAANSKIFSALLELKAKLDASFNSNLAAATAKLEKLYRVANASGNQIGKSFNRGAREAESAVSRMSRSVSRQFNSMIRHAREAGEQFHRAFSPLHGLGHVLGIGGLVGAGVGGFEMAHLIGEGSQVSAERESIKTQMRTILENQKKGGYLDSLWMQMRNYADKESVFHLNPVVESANQMLVSGVSADRVLAEMRKLGELAKDDEHLELVADIYSQANNQGYVTKGLLTRLQKDAKVPIIRALLQAMGKDDNLKNETELFKRLRNPAKDPIGMAYFEKALDILTGEGGALHGHQAEQLKTFAGQKSSADERLKDVLQGVGDISNRFAMPFLQEINKVNPQQIQSFFDKAVPQAEKLSHSIIETVHYLWDTGKIQWTWAIIRDIFAKISHHFERIKHGAKTFKDRAVEAFDAINRRLAWIDGHLPKIVRGLEGLAAALAVIRGIIFAGQLVGAFTALFAAMNPVTLTIGALAVGAGLLIANWDKVTPVLDPVIASFKNWFSTLAGDEKGNINSILNSLNDVMSNLTQTFVKLSPVLGPIVRGMLDLGGKVLRDGIDGIVQIVKGLATALDWLTTSFNKLLDSVHVDSYAKKADEIAKENSAITANGNAIMGTPGGASTGGLKLQSFGPISGDKNYDANWAPWGSGEVNAKGDHRLLDDDIAVSENVLAAKGLYMGQRVNLMDRATGTIIQAHARIGDKSYKGPNNPNVNVIESRKIKDYNRDIDIVPDNSSSQIHINSSPTINVHGSGDAQAVKKAVSEALDEHHKNLRKHLARAYQRDMRESFA